MRVASDVVIIGSGVAGALAACRLAEQGATVTILEAGPRIRRQEVVNTLVRTANADRVTAYPHSAHAPRPLPSADGDDYIRFTGPEKTNVEYLRVVGGTTWHWAGVTPRHLPGDFELHSRHGVGRDWPISHAALEPYYTLAERELGVSGPAGRNPAYPLPPFPLSHSDQLLQDAFGDIGIPFTHTPVARNSIARAGRSRCQGYSTCSPICPSGAQYAAIHHVEAAERLGVRVLADTRVDRLETGANGTITSVVARRSDGSSLAASGRAVLLAANAFESPRLLLMSASDRFPHGIANRSDQVGRNFFDHLGIAHRLQVDRPMIPGRGPLNLLICERFRDGRFRRERPAFMLNIHTHGELSQPVSAAIGAGLEPPRLDQEIIAHLQGSFGLEIVLEQLPQPGNRMTIDWNRRDSAGQPGMQVEYSFGEYERAGLAYANQFLRELSESLAARTLATAGPHSANHPMGMARMGHDPEDSVVDHECRAHDHRNLFIAGGAVFPTGGTANPTLTIAALTLRTADAIQRQLQETPS